MKLFIMLVSFTLSNLFVCGSALGEVEHQLVTKLHRSLGFSSTVFFNDKVYVNDLDENYQHVVKVFNANGSKLLNTIKLNHSGVYITPHNKNQILVLGRTSSPYWSSHISVITEQDKGYQVKSYNLGNTVIAESIVSDGVNIFANEKGESGIFLVENMRRYKKLPLTISGPARGLKIADSIIYNVELGNIFADGDENIFTYDLKSRTVKKLDAGAPYQGLTNIEIIGNMVVGTESASNEVVFIDRLKNKLLGRAHTANKTYGINKLDRCAVVVSDKAKKLTFLKYDEGNIREMATWDLSVAGDILKQPRSVDVDPKTGRVFVSSTYVCAGCQDTQSSVFTFADQGEIKELCK